MSKIIYLPFEELPQRYTQMWNESFIQQMDKDDIVVSVPNSKSMVINNGEFLDTFDTITYKQEQIKQVVNLFKDGKINTGDVFFVPDIFYPSLESIRYMSELNGIKVGVVTFNHAGRADENDFVQKLGKWSDCQEKAWHEISDVVLVGSNYHKEKVISKFNHNNVVVTGAIWDNEWMKEKTKDFQDKKEDFVIYPHRICKEKDFKLLIRIAKANKNLKFIITSSGKNKLENVSLPENVEYKYGLTKDEYYRLFAKAKYYLSTAKQETFGYTIQEAIFFKCKIIVPNRACCYEYVNRECVVNVEDMEKENYISVCYATKKLDNNTCIENNAGIMYSICKNLKVE